jgi:hypothetical protein
MARIGCPALTSKRRQNLRKFALPTIHQHLTIGKNGRQEMSNNRGCALSYNSSAQPPLQLHAATYMDTFSRHADCSAQFTDFNMLTSVGGEAIP